MFLEFNSKGLYQSLGKEKKSCCLVFPSSINKEFRNFHVVVVQRRQRNLQKSVMHVQSCCFAILNPLPSRRRWLSSLKSLIRRRYWPGFNRPLSSSKNPRFQNEAKCTTFVVKVSLFAWEWKIITIPKVAHLTSFWYRGPGELGIGLLGWFSNRTGTSIDDGARKSNNWLDQWHSGKLGTGSRV